MTLAEIRERPTHSNGVHKMHESVMRSWGVLEKTKELLRRGAPADVILEIIDDLQAAPSKLLNEDGKIEAY